MPVFRELWGWAAFAVLAIAGLATAVATTEWNGFWDFAIDVGHEVEPLWVSSAILVYTVSEGGAMLAKAFDRKLRAKYRAEGKAEGEAEGIAAVAKAIEQQGLSPEEIQDAIKQARKIIQRGSL